MPVANKAAHELASDPRAELKPVTTAALGEKERQAFQRLCGAYMVVCEPCDKVTKTGEIAPRVLIVSPACLYVCRRNCTVTRCVPLAGFQALLTSTSVTAGGGGGDGGSSSVRYVGIRVSRRRLPHEHDLLFAFRSGVGEKVLRVLQSALLAGGWGETVATVTTVPSDAKPPLVPRGGAGCTLDLAKQEGFRLLVEPLPTCEAALAALRATTPLPPPPATSPPPPPPRLADVAAAEARLEAARLAAADAASRVAGVRAMCDMRESEATAARAAAASAALGASEDSEAIRALVAAATEAKQRAAAASRDVGELAVRVALLRDEAARAEAGLSPQAQQIMLDRATQQAAALAAARQAALDARSVLDAARASAAAEVAAASAAAAGAAARLAELHSAAFVPQRDVARLEALRAAARANAATLTAAKAAAATAAKSAAATAAAQVAALRAELDEERAGRQADVAAHAATAAAAASDVEALRAAAAAAEAAARNAEAWRCASAGGPRGCAAEVEQLKTEQAMMRAALRPATGGLAPSLRTMRC